VTPSKLEQPICIQLIGKKEEELFSYHSIFSSVFFFPERIITSFEKS
jgi:hypothetical protein